MILIENLSVFLSIDKNDRWSKLILIKLTKKKKIV